MKKWIVTAVILGMVGWAVFSFVMKEDWKKTEVGIEKGNIAPDFELETIDGDVVKLSDFRGEKIMLNFWGTWCPPCRAEMPDMQKFHENEKGIILAVNLTETERSPQNINRFIDEFGITFEVLLDKSTVVGNMYNSRTLPTSYFIDSEGKIQHISIGPMNYESIVNEFEKMN